MNALEQYEIEELEHFMGGEEQEGFGIHDDEMANWAFRKIKALEANVDSTKQLANKERDRITEWEQQMTTSDQESIKFFEMKLAEYLMEKRKTDKKAKVKTPYGTVSTRKKPDSWEYSENAVNELKEMGLTDLIKTVESVKKAEVKKAVQVVNGKVISPDGEIIESIQVIPQGDAVVVKVEK